MDDSIQLTKDQSENNNNDDDDNDVVIIDNPFPKKPVIVLCISDDDNDDDDEKNLNGNPTEAVKDTVNHDGISKTCSKLIDLDYSDHDKDNNKLINNKSKQMKDWYDKFKKTNPTGSYNPNYYTCRECQAVFSSALMIDKHIRMKHPNSIFLFDEKNSNHGSNINSNLLSEASIQACTNKDNSTNTSPSNHVKLNDVQGDVAIVFINDDKDTSRKKLSPLKSNNGLHSTLKIPLWNSPDKCLPKLPKLKPTANMNPLHPVSRSNIQESCVSTSSTAKSGISAQPVKSIGQVSSSCKTPQLNQYSKCQNPLTVIVCSSKKQERTVLVSPLVDENKHVQHKETMNTKQTSSVDHDAATPGRVVKFFSSQNNQNEESNCASDNCNTRLRSSKSPLAIKRRHIKPLRRRQAMQMSNKLITNIETSNTLSSGSTTTYSHTGAKALLVGTSRKRKRVPLPNDSHEQNVSKKQKGNGTNLKTVQCQFCCKKFGTVQGQQNHISVKHKEHLPKRKSQVPLKLPKPPDLKKLSSMKHIVMIDIDNWRKIFQSNILFAPSTFVWAFQCQATNWYPSRSSVVILNLLCMDCFYLHPKCGNSKDAADFALCVQAGKLDVQLPKEIPFTVLSGDKGFRELENQLKLSKREVHIIDPHNKTIDNVLAMINSITVR